MKPIVDAYCTLGTERETELTGEELLRLMDRAGIDRAVIAPDDREIAVDNTAGNQRILEAGIQAPGRFLPACSVNPWYGQAGCEQLRRAVGSGARILVLAPALQGFCLGDEVARDLLAAAGRLNVPVYVHTGPHSVGAPTQLLLVASEHPSTRFILGHCGSTDYSCDMTAVFELGLKNVWYELSLMRPWAVVEHIKHVDRSRLIFGSSAPRNDPVFELQQFAKHLPIEEYPDIYGHNITRLLEEAV